MFKVLFCRNDICISRCHLTSSTKTLDYICNDKIDRIAAKPLSEMPGPRGFPYFGTYFNYKYGKWPITEYHYVLSQLFRKYGPLVKEERCGERIVHIFEPELAKTIFQNDGSTPFIKPLMETTQVYRQEREMSPGLGNTNGKEWIRMRSAAVPFLMRPERLTDAVLSTVDRVVLEAVDWLATLGQVSNLEKRISLWQLESGVRVVTQRRLGLFDCPNIGYRLYEGNRNVFKLTSRLKYSLPFYRYLPNICPSFRKLSTEEDGVFGQGQRWLDEAWVEYCQVEKIDSKKAAEVWPVLHYFSETSISKSERDIICLGMIFDGLSTTSPTVIAILYCLAKNPAAQEKAADEAKAALRMQNGHLSYEILSSRLSYIRACIKEAMRLYTITTDISRITQRDLVVGGYFLPAKTVVEINTHSLFRDSKFIPSPPDVNSFAPERWLKAESATAGQVHPFLVLPFGHGPRMCAGRRFAEVEMLTLITRLLSRFRIHWTGDGELRQVYETLLFPHGVLSLSLEKRSS